MVKADAYGHGAVPIAERALAEGADWLGVARIGEALELRRAGIDAPVMIFGYTSPERAEELLGEELTQAVFDVEMATALSDRVAASGGRLRCHLKLDTGMGRLGLVIDPMASDPERRAATTAALDDAAAIAALPGLELEGVFTHFASADRFDKSDTRIQLDRFLTFLEAMRGRGIEAPLRHAANSSALIEVPESHLDLVRPGIATYGLAASDEVDWSALGLEPVLQLESRIVQLRRLPAGSGVSYGSTWRTTRPTLIATVAAGYADGLNRLLSSRGRMLVRGQSAPIVGRVCMDFSMLDVGHIEGVRSQDRVTIIGRQQDATLTADAVAAQLDTISYEVVTGIPKRVPRLYA